MLKAFMSFRKLMGLWPQLMKSKTLIVNAVTIILAMSTSLLDLPIIQQYPEVVAFLSATLVPAANIILRFFTKEAVTAKSSLWD